MEGNNQNRIKVNKNNNTLQLKCFIFATLLNVLICEDLIN